MVDCKRLGISLCIFFGLLFLMVLPFALAMAEHRGPAANVTDASASDPWTPAQTVRAPSLAAELKQGAGERPVIIYVGVRTLYAGGHIPGAVFYGPGSSEQGVSELKKFAGTISKDSEVILYCGCCPLTKCPNIRPAFAVMEKMGFRRLRVLILPTSFAVDWAEKGYPVENSQHGT